jgi:iron complex outermembrane receptor protein
MISRAGARVLARVVAVALGLAFVESVYADAASESGDQLSEVIVTATKRESTVQETSASITAVSGEDIADRGLVDFNSLAQSVPGIAMRTSGPGQTEFEMRGLNSAGGNTSMVGFYLDETPLSSPASAQLGKVEIDPALYDLNRVEVLRGPQGTLYGSSSMGGTVKVVPNAPELGKFTASGEDVISDTTSGGSINHKINGMVNLPLGDTAAVRIVGSESSDSGWIKRLVIQDGAVAVDAGAFPFVTRPANFYTAPLQEQIDGANSTTVDSVRMSLLWKPIDNLSITPMVMWQLTQQAAPDAVDVNGNPTHPTFPATSAHWEIYDSPEPQRDRFTLSSLKIEYQLESFSITSATADWNRNTLVSQDSTEENAAPIGIPVYDAPTGIGPTGPAPNGPAVTEKTTRGRSARSCASRQPAPAASSGSSVTSTRTCIPNGTSGPSRRRHQRRYGRPQLIRGLPAAGHRSELGVRRSLLAIHARLQGHGRVCATTTTASARRTRNLGLSLCTGAWETTSRTTRAASNGASGTDPKFDLSYNLDKDVLLYATAAKGFRLGGVNQPIPWLCPGTPIRCW